MNKELIHKILLTCLIIASSVYIYSVFPKLNEYKLGADEGTYYRQGKTILTNGFSGFQILAKNYVQDSSKQLEPHPLRIGHTISTAILLKIKDSIFMLSLKSWIYFILILLCSNWYIKKIWGTNSVFYIVILLSISPLITGMSKRALIDIESLFYTILALFQFLYYINNSSNKNFYLFTAFLSISCFFKETAFFLIPFYFIILLFLKLKNEKISLSKIFICCITPFLVVGIVDLILFQGLDILIEILKILFNSSNHYMNKFGNGPWFQYLIDFLLLSPFVSTMGIFFIGYCIINREKKLENMVIIALFLYLIILYSFIPKNVRFLLMNEFLLCIFSGLFIMNVYNNYKGLIYWKDIILYSGLMFLIYNGYKSFNNYFVKYNIYDPIGYNLLYAAQIIPNKELSKINSKQKILSSKELSNKFLENSLKHYQLGEYKLCIKEAKKSIQINPSADAYNNICAAYNQLKEFDNAVEACNKAIKLEPAHRLANGNLKYAISQKYN
ncbi:hypothetical protein ACFQ5N_02555 [Lutibacter holmesii]|uniref:Tetratricopeptide repeat protein n=1 Tax=Lutibacter holmesii TaxID=1137985 RepID=A0ABW3WK91_9FLAO